MANNIRSNSAVDALLVGMIVSLWMQPVPLPKEAGPQSAPVVHLEVEHKPGSKFWPYKELKGAAHASSYVLYKVSKLAAYLAADGISFMDWAVSSNACCMLLLVMGLQVGCTMVVKVAAPHQHNQAAPHQHNQAAPHQHNQVMFINSNICLQTCALRMV